VTTHIELTEISFAEGDVRELVVNTSLIYGTQTMWDLAPGTLLKLRGGLLHVRESARQIEQLIRHAKQYAYARLADLSPDPTDEIFATLVLPAPIYVRNRVRSRPEDLTLNGVDLRYLIEQHQHQLEGIREEALSG
jgi:hypothetical protein